MAESFEPDGYQEPDTKWFRYPWKEWMAEPFRIWVISPEEDFPIYSDDLAAESTKMGHKLRNQARNKGLRVHVNTRDPLGKYRIAFCFYKDDHAPVVHFMSSSETVTASYDGIVVECQFEGCSVSQPRSDLFAHVKECLTRNPHNPSDPGMYAVHRPDALEIAGMRKVPFADTWPFEGT